MNWFSRIIAATEAEINAIPGQIANLFTKDQTQIHDAISAAQSALGTAATVAAITGENGAATKLGQISSVLTGVSATADTLATPESMTQVAATISDEVSGFVQSGVAFKNSGTQAVIDHAVAKTNEVVVALSNGAANLAASGSGPASLAEPSA